MKHLKKNFKENAHLYKFCDLPKHRSQKFNESPIPKMLILSFRVKFILGNFTTIGMDGSELREDAQLDFCVTVGKYEFTSLLISGKFSTGKFFSDFCLPKYQRLTVIN